MPAAEQQNAPPVWTLRQLLYLLLSLKLAHSVRDTPFDKFLRVISSLAAMLTLGRAEIPPSFYLLKQVMGVKDSDEFERCACPNGLHCCPHRKDPVQGKYEAMITISLYTVEL